MTLFEMDKIDGNFAPVCISVLITIGWIGYTYRHVGNHRFNYRVVLIDNGIHLLLHLTHKRISDGGVSSFRQTHVYIYIIWIALREENMREDDDRGGAGHAGRFAARARLLRAR